MELVANKEVLAAVIGALVAVVGALVLGFILYVRTEKSRKRVEIFTALATSSNWVQANSGISEKLNTIPIVFDRIYRDAGVRIAYRNYHLSLSTYSTIAKVTVQGNEHTVPIELFTDQRIWQRSLVRELAIACGWMSKGRAADYDFSTLQISLSPQSEILPVNTSIAKGNQPPKNPSQVAGTGDTLNNEKS